jgi:hypothetical protein
MRDHIVSALAWQMPMRWALAYEAVAIALLLVLRHRLQANHDRRHRRQKGGSTMRSFIGRHRAAAVIVGIAVALMLAAVGYAWYAGAGSGSNASAAVAGSSPQAVTVTVDSNASALYPGGSEPINVHITAASGTPYIGTVSFAVNPAASGCLASWFSIPPVAVNARAPQDVTGTLTFNDLNLDQSACSDSNIAVTATAAP